MNMASAIVAKFSFRLILLIALMVGGPGCVLTQFVLENTPVESPVFHDTRFAEDQILALGKPARALPEAPNISSQAVILVGDQYNYVLTEGGETLKEVLFTLNPQKLQAEGEQAFFAQGNKGYFTSELSLIYNKDFLSPAERKLFFGNSALTVTEDFSHAGRYLLTVKLSGLFFQAKDLSGIREQQAISLRFPVTIYQRTTEKEINIGNLGARVVLLPIAVTFDVVIYPVQIYQSAFEQVTYAGNIGAWVMLFPTVVMTEVVRLPLRAIDTVIMTTNTLSSD